MHKKTIRGVPYFYTTVREGDKTKTIYLGKDYDEALNEEKKLHRILENLGKEDKKFGILKLFFIFISVLVLFHGIYSLFNLSYIGLSIYDYGNTELNINKFVSPDAVLVVNGISQAIPLQLNDDMGVLGYDIKKLKLNLEFGEYLVEIKDRNNVIYRENVVVSRNAASESIENNSFTEPVIEDIANSSVNEVTPQDFGIMAAGAASVTVDLNMTYLGNSTKYGNNATCYNVTTTNSDTIIYNWWKNNVSDTVLNMPFDTNSSTTTNDYSGYGNNGNVSITSAIKPTWNISGYIGGAYTFDGVDDWINISDSNILDLTNNISIEAWINPGSVQKAYADIADKGHNGATSTSGWVIQQNNLNQNQYYLAWYAGAGWQVSSTIALTANRWQHFAIVKNELNVKAYQDGVQKFDWNATNATIQTNDIAVVIGNAYGLSRQFNGTIDEFKIYNRTLSLNEILDHNNSIYNKVRNDRLVVGQNWTCQVYPNNNTGDGLNVNSSNLFIVSNSVSLISNINITSDSSTNASNGNLTGRFTCSDLDGLDTLQNETMWYNQSKEIIVFKNFTLITSGNLTKGHQWNFTVRCGDGTDWGYWGNNLSYITIGNIAPSVPTLLIPLNNSNISTQNVTFGYNSTDADGDTISYSLFINGILNQSSIGNVSLNFTDGNYNWSIIAGDSSGNSSFAPNMTFTVDATKPIINITYPTNNTNTSNNNLNINYSVSDLNLDKCWYSNDSMSINTTITCGTNITTITWSEGLHNFTIWANDSVNNVNSSSVSFTIDTTAPNITYQSPTENNGVNLSQSYITVNVSVNDSLDIIDTCRFNLNNTWYGMTKSSGNNFVYCNATISSLADGAYNYNITANDTLNNLGNSSTRAIRLDTTGPSVNITDPSNGDIITTNSLTINSIISDSLALDKCWYEHSNLNTTFVCGQNFSLSSLSNNDYNISVWANDTLNNLRRDTVKFTISVAGTTTIPSGGGGGGGGSPSSTAGQIITQETETKIQLKQGQEKDSSLTFTNPGNEDLVINAIIPEGLIGKIMLKNEHSASSLIIKGKTAMFTLSSNPITLTMNIGETKKIDLDGDNKEESEVSLIDIIDDIIKLKIKTNEDTQTLILSTGESKQFITNSNFAYLKIKPGETNNLKISIIGKQPGIYVGNIIIKTNGVEKLIPITIEVNSENTMFNAILDLPEEYKNINLKDNLKVQITLSNKEAGVMKVRYVIKDSNGIEKYNVNESIYVNEFRSYTKDIDTIKLKEGEYIIGIEARYKNEVIVSSDRFRIAKEQGYGLITLVIIWILIILIVVRWYKKKLTKAF